SPYYVALRFLHSFPTRRSSDLQLGKLDAAADQFRDALRLNPRLAQAQVLLGVTLRRKGDHATALAHFRKAVEIDPKDPEAQLNLDRKSTRLNSSHQISSYAVFC